MRYLALTSFNYTENKTFILISSVLSWSDTPPKEFIDENTGEAIEVTSIKTGKTGRTYGTQNTVCLSDLRKIARRSRILLRLTTQIRNIISEEHCLLMNISDH